MEKALFLCLLLGLTACSDSISQAQVSVEKAKRTTIVSASQPADVIPASWTYSWTERVNIVPPHEKFNQDTVKKEFRAAVRTAMEQKGYRFEPVAEQADLLMGFLVAMESSMRDEEIGALFGLSPGLMSSGEDPERYEKGTVVIAVLNPVNQQVYWHTALQGFADFEQTKPGVQSRLNGLVAQMLSDFPLAGK